MDVNANPVVLLAAAASVMAQVIYALVKRRRDNGAADLRNDIHALRKAVEEVRGLVQSIITKLTLVEYRVQRLEDDRTHRP